ncbi:MAG: HPr-rel-A system PqqD family peptide chaperone [Betaproteobacteria bacterium]
MQIAVNQDMGWRLGVVGPLPMRCWDGDYVVYNPLSGNTHVFDIVTGEVLKVIMTGNVAAAEICQRIAAFLEVPNDVGIADHVGRILVALDRLALIEPAAGC